MGLERYPIKGSKHLDFLDFKTASIIIKNKEHSPMGLKFTYHYIPESHKNHKTPDILP